MYQQEESPRLQSYPKNVKRYHETYININSTTVTIYQALFHGRICQYVDFDMRFTFMAM